MKIHIVFSSTPEDIGTPMAIFPEDKLKEAEAYEEEGGGYRMLNRNVVWNWGKLPGLKS